MKKSILMLAAIAMVFVACGKKDKNEAEEKFVATFEEAAISPANANSEFFLDTTGTFQSGNFIFKQTSMPNYHSCHVVTNHKDTTFVDYNDAWKSIAGGAHEGNNYVVWNLDYYGNDTITLQQAAKVPGFYVTNTAYAYSSMKNGDSYAGGPFVQGDYFRVQVIGLKNGAQTGEVWFDLGRDTELLDTWMYVDLSRLDEVDALTFRMDGSRSSYGYLNTPAYFAFDDLGAKK